MKSVTSRWMVGLLLLAATTAAGATDLDGLSAPARRALFLAQGYLEDDLPARAVEVLEGLAGEHYLVHYTLANALVRCDRKDEALNHYRAAVQDAPDFAPGWLHLGDLAYELGRYDEAAPALLSAHTLSPDPRPELLYYAAVAFHLAGNPGRAISVLEDLVSGERGEVKLDWYRALVSIASEAGRTEVVAGALDGILAHFGADPDAWLLLYRAAGSSGDYRRAAVALTIVGYLRELTPSEERALSDLYLAIDIPAAAGRRLEMVVADSTRAEDYERLVGAYMLAHEPEEALAAATRGIEEAPTPRLWSLLGDLHYAREEYAASRRAFERLLETGTQTGRAHLMLGYCAIELGRPAEALDHLRAASRDPEYEGRARRLIDQLR